jgi:hypothetical protein
MSLAIEPSFRANITVSRFTRFKARDEAETVEER